MDSVAYRIASVVLAKDQFYVTDTLGALRGETIEASKLPAYEQFFRDTAEAYLKKKEELERQKTPGRSNPKAGQLGMELQRLRKKGAKARARIQVAEWLKRRNLKALKVGDKASGEPEDMTVLKNPQEDLKGETIFANKLKQYESDWKRAQDAYKQQKKENKDLSGAARGRGGQALAKLGREMRLAEARVYAARQLLERGLEKAVL